MGYRSPSTVSSSTSLMSRLRGVFQHVAVQCGLGAAVLASAAGVTSYQHESKKEGYLPLAYSDHADVSIATTHVNGRLAGPLTLFHISLHDGLMTIFDANNQSYAKDGGSHESFARALRDMRLMSSPLHRSISDYARSLPYHVEGAKQSVRPLTDAARDLQPALAALHGAWRASRQDFDRTERYSEEDCEDVTIRETLPDGSSSTRTEHECETVWKTREVYDYSIHTYTYNQAKGVRAARLLADYAERYPDIRIDEALRLNDHVSEANRAVILGSRPEQKNAEHPLSEREIIALSNTWAMGSTYSAKVPVALAAHASVLRLAQVWGEQARRAHSVHYRTESQIDSGPAEYQTVEAAIRKAQDLAMASAEISGTLQVAGSEYADINRKTNAYVRVVLEGAPGNADQLRADILSQSRALYTRSFSAGFDVDPANWWSVALWSVLAAVAGAGGAFGAGRGVQALQDRRTASASSVFADNRRGYTRF